MSPAYDVIVVGSGTAGAKAAYTLGEAGRRVLVLEKAHLPRYKACSGGLSTRMLGKYFSFSFDPVVEARVHRVTFALGHDAVHVPLRGDTVCTVMRDHLDAYILAHARAEVLQGVSVDGSSGDPRRGPSDHERRPGLRGEICDWRRWGQLGRCPLARAAPRQDHGGGDRSGGSGGAGCVAPLWRRVLFHLRRCALRVSVDLPQGGAPFRRDWRVASTAGPVAGHAEARDGALRNFARRRRDAWPPHTDLLPKGNLGDTARGAGRRRRRPGGSGDGRGHPPGDQERTLGGGCDSGRPTGSVRPHGLSPYRPLPRAWDGPVLALLRLAPHLVPAGGGQPFFSQAFVDMLADRAGYESVALALFGSLPWYLALEGLLQLMGPVAGRERILRLRKAISLGVPVHHLGAASTAV